MFYHMQFSMDATSKVLRRFKSTKSLINFKRFSILSKSLLLIQQLYKFVCNKISLCLVHMPAIPYLLQTEFLDGQEALNVVVYYFVFFVSVTNIQYDIHFQGYVEKTHVCHIQFRTFVKRIATFNEKIYHRNRQLLLLSWEETNASVLGVD